MWHEHHADGRLLGGGFSHDTARRSLRVGLSNVIWLLAVTISPVCWATVRPQVPCILTRTRFRSNGFSITAGADFVSYFVVGFDVSSFRRVSAGCRRCVAVALALSMFLSWETDDVAEAA